MKTQHVFNDAYYVIGNKAVAKCFFFNDQEDVDRIKEKVDEYLKPICKVIGFGIVFDEFRLLIKMKSRKEIEHYYVNNYKHNPEAGDIIPETTYIFAQNMANLQSGYVKYFNFKYQRDGGLTAGRYYRELVESEEDLERKLEEINEMAFSVPRKKIWTFERKEKGFIFRINCKAEYRSSKAEYEGKVGSSGMKCFHLKKDIYLRGDFDELPPKRIIWEDKRENMKNLIAFMFMKVRVQ